MTTYPEPRIVDDPVTGRPDADARDAAHAWFIEHVGGAVRLGGWRTDDIAQRLIDRAP